MRTARLPKLLYGLFGFICITCLFSLFPTVAQGQYTLAGNWNFNSIVSGPSAPWWERGTLTVASDGTFSGSGTESNSSSSSNTVSLSGSFSISANGIVMTLKGQPNTGPCWIDSSNTLMTCTQTLNDGSANLTILTLQPSLYSLSDLADTWEGNILSSGFTPSTGSTGSKGSTAFWERESETINSDGTFTGSYTKSDKSTGTLSGTLSVSTDGITCVKGCPDASNFAATVNTANTIMVGTSGAVTTTSTNPATTTTDDANLIILTEQNTSFTIDNLAGTTYSTWQGSGLASGPSAYWWENDSLTIYANGTYSFAWNGSNGQSGTENGTVSISSEGIITLNNLGSTTVGVIDPSSTVMVFTGTWTDGTTQQIRIFTNGTTAFVTQVSSFAYTYGTPTTGSNPLASTTGFSSSTGSSLSSQSSLGTPTAAAGTVFSNTGGGTASQAGGNAPTGSSRTNDAANTPAAATNAAGTSPAPSNPSSSATPSTPATVPDAPEIVVATPRYSEASVSFRLPANGGNLISGCTVTSNPDGIKATGSGSPIIVSGLTNGTPYTFTVTAANKIGTGPPSAASNSVTPAITVPDAPVIVKAKADNAGAKVSFEAPASNGGSRITSYTVRSNAGQTASGPASPITVKGLTNGRSYTFTVAATNKIGKGPPSRSSNSVTPATAPDAPAIVKVKADGGRAKVSFKAPASNGGSHITSYTVTSNAGQTASGPSSPITVTGLTNGTPYTFTVTAANEIGTGPPSNASNSVVPRSSKTKER